MRKFNVTVDGKKYEVEVEEVRVENSNREESVVSNVPVVKKVENANATISAGEKMTSPMPGMIVSFKVENGTKVKKGQAVVVLEAMKMENEITSPKDGVFKAVATKGASVNTGDVIAIIE